MSQQHGTYPLTNTEVLRGSLEQRVLGGLGGLAGTERCGSGLLSGSLSGLGLVIETRYISDCTSTTKYDAVPVYSEL